MLETFYNNFGFFGSILLAFVVFILFIFWMAGIAGIACQPDNKSKNTQMVLSILFPPYPLCWLFIDMYQQKQLMSEE